MLISELQQRCREPLSRIMAREHTNALANLDDLQGLAQGMLDEILDDVSHSAGINPLLVRLGIALTRNDEGAVFDLLKESTDDVPLTKIINLVAVATGQKAGALDQTLSTMTRADGSPDANTLIKALAAISTAVSTDEFDAATEFLFKASSPIPNSVASMALIDFQLALIDFVAHFLQRVAQFSKGNE
jgi:hypothetical protein